jgi:hypothetical protein
MRKGEGVEAPTHINDSVQVEDTAVLFDQLVERLVEARCGGWSE